MARTGGSMGGGEGTGEQHTTMPNPGRGGRTTTHDDRSSSSSWGDDVTICEPTKPSGTPASHGGSKGR